MNEGRQLGMQFGEVVGELDPIWALIREVRLERGLTMDQLAKMAGVASSTVSRGERGYHTWLDKTRKVAEAVGIWIITTVPPSIEDGNIE